MSVLATNQYTIYDYNDTVNLQPYIYANVGRSQIYDPDKNLYNPSWTPGTPCMITAALFKAGGVDLLSNNDSSITQNVQWKYRDASNTLLDVPSTSGYTRSGTKGRILSINVNDLASVTTKTYIAQITYKDPGTEEELTYSEDITFTKSIGSEGLVMAQVAYPTGASFQNGYPESITIHCDLLRGSNMDTTNNTYSWYIIDSAIASGTAPSGLNWSPQNHPGWRLLASNLASSYTGVTGADLTIYPKIVTGWANFKCVILDSDTGISYWDVADIVDLSDNFQIDVLSSTGKIMKNGTGATLLYCEVRRGDSLYDQPSWYPQCVSVAKPTSPATNQYWLDISWSGSTPTNTANGTTGYGTLYKYNGTTWDPQPVYASTTGNTYTWAKYDSGGNLVSSWTPQAANPTNPTTKSSKYLFITHQDVDSHANFIVNLG